MRGGSIAARGEAGPVVEVDDADIAVGRYDAVAAINLHIEHVRRVLAYLAHLVLVKFQALALAIDGFVAILAMTLVKWIEPIEEPRTRHAVKLDKVAHKVLIDDRSLDAAEEIFLQHLLRFLGMTHIRHILLVHGMEVAALYPATAETRLYELAFDHLVGVDHQAVGIWDVVPHEYTCHALSRAILDAVARVDYQSALLLELLEQVDRPALAAHIHYYIFFDTAVDKLLLGVDIDLTTAFAQLLGDGVEYCGIVADMIGGIGSRSHYCRYLYVSHGG